MIKFRWESPAIPVEYFPDEKKVLLLSSYQQDVQKGGPELCRGCQVESFVSLFTSESLTRSVVLGVDTLALRSRQDSKFGMGSIRNSAE